MTQKKKQQRIFGHENNNKSQQEPVPQDVELSCTGRALTYPQKAAGLSNYLYLQPDSQVDAQPQFAFGVLWFGCGPINPLGLFCRLVFQELKPSLRGGSATLRSDPFHLEVSEASSFPHIILENQNSLSLVIPDAEEKSTQVKLYNTSYIWMPIVLHLCACCKKQNAHTYTHTRAYAFKLVPAEKNSSNAAESSKVDAGLRTYLLLFQLSVILDAHSSVRRHTEKA